ncbi:MAG: hypothetical protein KF802_01470 [Bdellovibrionaceae bacterium]|nr:hypothetical protein [Pseudobdellovibrionaceae bacterium]
MKFARLLIFILAFQVNLRVKAVSDATPVGDPENCWTQAEGRCDVQAGRRPLRLKSAGLELWAEGESLLSRDSTQWRFLKGSVRASGEKTSELSFPQGKLLSQGGEFWILEDGPRFVARAVRGSLRVEVRDGRELNVPEGLEVWIGPMSTSGQIAHGVPTLIPLEDHLKRWSRLGDLPREKFVQEAKELKERWKGREQSSSDLYQRVADRHLASIAEEKEKKAERERRQKAERDRFRRLLYERAFER